MTTLSSLFSNMKDSLISLDLDLSGNKISDENLLILLKSLSKFNYLQELNLTMENLKLNSE